MHDWTRRRAAKALLIGTVPVVSFSARWSEAEPAVAPNKSRSGATENKVPVWLTLPTTPDLPDASRAGWLALNGARIFFAQFGGEGPQVLLLHGGLANSNYWGLQVRELAKSFSVTVRGIQLQEIFRGRRSIAGRFANLCCFDRWLERWSDHRASIRADASGSSIQTVCIWRKQFNGRIEKG